MVAHYRAMESERPDAIFRDPFAGRLAGAAGQAIVSSLPRGKATAWALIVRTAIFDDIIMDRVGNHGIDLVLNLAAGLDARPWRLPLPPSLRWVDVDLPAILEHKDSLLRDERTTCRYEAVTADLTQPADRDALLLRVSGTARRVLVVSEGLLLYLTPEQVGELARALYQPPAFRWWLTDIMSPRLRKMLEKTWGPALRKGGAPFQFAPAEGTAFFRPFGWHEILFRSTLEEAHRLRREARMMWLWRALSHLASRQRREEFRRMSGSVLLERDEMASDGHSVRA